MTQIILNHELLDDMILYNTLSQHNFRLWRKILRNLGLDPQSKDPKTLEVIEVLSELSTREAEDIDFMNSYRRLEGSRNNVTANPKG